jgi:outer membrane protein assembly factor BamB
VVSVLRFVRFATGSRRSVPAVIAVLVASVGLLAAPAAAADWPQFGNDPTHSGVASPGSHIAAATAGSLRQSFRVTLPDVADGSPAYQSNVATSGGSRDLLFVTTHNGTTIALDAHTGATIWSKQVGPGNCHINNGSSICYTTASPAVDPSGAFVYAYGLDGRAHKYASGTGVEVTTGGWPELTTSKPFDEKGSADLSIATARSGVSYLYVANGGYPGDAGDYQGHLTTINLSTGGQVVFNTQCSNQAVHFAETPGTPDCAQKQSAVWARPGVVYDPALDRIFFVTGNADYNPAAFDWGDTVIALSPDGTSSGGQPLDTWTPANFQALDAQDLDLGSTAPTIIPPQAGSSVANLGVQGGKDAMLHLLNLADLSGQGGPGHTGGEIADTAVPQGGQVLTQPLAWTDPGTGVTWVITATNSGISGSKVQVTNGAPSLTTSWSSSTGGFSPVLVGGVVLYVTANGLVALDATTGRSPWSDNVSTNRHWNSPIVVGDTVYYTDGSNHLTSFIASAEPATTPLATLVGDVTGDGKADAIDVFPTGTYVRASSGSSFGSPVLWSGQPFYGSRVTLVGDVTGDGKADLVAVNDGSSWVMASSGSSFGSPVLWSGQPFYGSRVTLVGDVTGDGKADLVAVNDGSSWVMVSSGRSFGSPALWSR